MKKLKKILIIDDNEGALKLFHLQLRGYETYTERDSRNAIESFNKAAPDLVILDYSMPHIDGAEIAKQIKLIDEKCKILMVSTAPREEVDLQNVDLFLRKPVHPETLQQVIEELFELTE